MDTSAPHLEQVLTLARQLTTADQARLVAQLTPIIASAFEADQHPQPFHPGSRAAQLASDPTSALARALSIANAESRTLTDDDIARLREERFDV